MTIPSSVRRTPSANRTLNSYPSQFFDISSQYIPPSVKELFRWCQYLYVTHSEIAPVINKKCAYVITDLIYETQTGDDPGRAQKLWQEVLERDLNIREMEYKLLLDLEVYGNAFCSISFPFERYLICNNAACKAKKSAKNVKWKYEANEFRGMCEECNSKVNFTAEDKPIKNRRRIKIIRWYPQYIDIHYNPFTNRSTYIYRIPTWLRKRIGDTAQNKTLVEDTPIEFLKAIREKKNIQFDTDNIYHFKNPSISMEDDAFGTPPMLSIFKDAWLYQTYKRAQEAIAIDHVLPMTLLIPSSPGGDMSPHLSVNLNEWAGKMQNIVQKWRRDPIGIFTVPFPAMVQNVRGDAKALNAFDEMNQVRQQIIGGLDVPQEFIYGGLNWSGSSISLRVLENLFISKVTQLNNFLRDFIVPRVKQYCDLPSVIVRHRDFKMADDVQQKQIALGLRQTNTISDQSTVEELGFDYGQEQDRKRSEEKERIAQLTRMAVAQAEAQGQGMIIQARYQAKAQIEMQKAQQQAMQQQQAEQQKQMAQQQAQQGMMGGKPGQMDPAQAQQMAAQQGQQQGQPQEGQPQEGQPQEQAPQGQPQGNNQMMLDTMVQNFLKTYPPDMRDEVMNQMRQSNPELARAIQTRIRLIERQAKTLTPLPEQRAPTSARSNRSSV